MNPATSFEAARRLTRHHARSFYFSSFPLPADKRLAAFAIYAFCRYCDDAVDAAEGGGDAAARAAAGLGPVLDAIYAGTPPEELPWAAAFAETVRRYEIPRKLCEELIHGVTLDARPPIRIADWPELREYCYFVASVVGLVMARVFGMARPEAAEQAEALGIAMQLTNILRDVREDFERDRIYLPADELAAHGLATDALPDFASPEWKRYARFFAARARSHYAEAERGIPALSADGSQYCVWCMSEIYAAILGRIEAADYDVSVRRKVGLPAKLWLAGRAFVRYKRGL